MPKFINVQSVGPAVAGLSLILAGLGLAGVGATPAAAQFYGYGVPYNTPEPPAAFGRPAPVFRGYDRPLPPDEIVERLEDRGFEEVSRPRFDGQNYVVEAVNPRGLRVRLVIDAFRGHVVDRFAVDRGPAGRDDEPLFGPRPDQPRFGNNAPLSPVPVPDIDRRSARIDPPGSVETAPLAGPSVRPERSLPAPRDSALAPHSPSDKAASLPKPVRPAGSAVEGGNPDLLKGEQRKPVASAPHSTTPAPTPSPIASPVVQPAPAAQAQPAQPEIVAVKPDIPKADALSPIKPLKPQVAPDAATLNAESGRSPEKTVRVIGGVTPVPAPATGGPITADSNDVKP